LPDQTNCMAVRAFLRMSGLDFKVEMRPNAEHMSPSGKVPFIKCGPFVVAEFENIVAFVNTKGIQLSGHLDMTQKADMRAYMSLIINVLVNAELYLTWCNRDIYDSVTKVQYGSVYPWPLNRVLSYRKKSEVRRKLSAISWNKKTVDEIYYEVENCLSALSARLGNQPYFFNKPTELDALLFGHLFTCLTIGLPDNRLKTTIQGYHNLVTFCQNIERDFFTAEEQ